MSKELDFRDTIGSLEQTMSRRSDQVHLESDTTHHFAHGVYGRELLIRAGCTLTGKIHRYSCINVITKGTITVKTEEGNKLIKGPCVIVSPPGTKRAGFAHTDTIWITFHHTDQTDPDKVEDEVIAKDFYELENVPAPKLPPAGLTEVEERTLNDLLRKRDNA